MYSIRLKARKVAERNIGNLGKLLSSVVSAEWCPVVVCAKEDRFVHVWEQCRVAINARDLAVCVVVNYGCQIIDKRDNFIDELNFIIGEVHKKLTNGKEHLEINYEPNVERNDFERELREVREKDIRYKKQSKNRK